MPRRRKELAYYPPPTADRLERRGPGRRSSLPLPWPVQALLLAGLLGLGAIAVLVGSGTLARTAGGLGNAVADVVAGFVGTASPAASGAPGAEPAPRLDAPVSAYTADGMIDVTGRLPSGVPGMSDATIRVYVAGKFVSEIEVPPTTDFRVADVPLDPGRNDVTATIVTAAGESEPSDPISVTYLDGAPPITLSTPKNGGSVATATVPVRGTTRAGARVTVRNSTTGATTTVIASAQGAFAVNVALTEGANALTVTVVDPAGNSGQASLTVIRGSGALSAKVTLSWYSMKASRLPQSLTITVRVLDVGGRAVADGSQATFSVSPPGLPTAVSDPQPTRAGVATWKLTIPPSAASLPASGLITVSVALTDGRMVTATGAFTITK
ncbi:MAG TPA: Ig-like domain-containing protein [Candidatus Dormibacteraeota bacterium]|nr:Ig-like domain-containing protein [Candidatus Dormibacteraeota bacterium]